METKRWIKCTSYKDGGNQPHVIEVRQTKSCCDRFEDKDGNIYGVNDLDFTQKQDDEQSMEAFKKKIEESNEEALRTQERFNHMLESIDAKSIADHQAAINEREYWRNLRCNIALKIIEKHERIDPVYFCESTKIIFDKLYAQHQIFNQQYNNDGRK